MWTSTNLIKTHWDDITRQWTVTLDRQQEGKAEERTLLSRLNKSQRLCTLGILHPRHIVLATGHSGEPYIPTSVTGVESFEGDRLVHSSEFTEPTKNAKGKKAVVIGSCNSGHDIARDYYDNGYDITMVQRSSTLVITSKTLIDVTMKGLYEEDGVSACAFSYVVWKFLPFLVFMAERLRAGRNWGNFCHM